MTFSVETETLRALADDLARVDSELKGLSGLVGGYAGLLGASKVESALNDFVHNWSQGVQMVTSNAAGLQQVAANAADAYDAADQSIGQAAAGNSTSSSSSSRS